MASVLVINQQYIRLPTGVTLGIHVLQCTAAAAQTLTVPYMGGNSTDTAMQLWVPAGHPAIAVVDNGSYTVTCTAAAGEQNRDFIVVTQHGTGGNLNMGAEDDDHFD